MRIVAGERSSASRLRSNDLARVRRSGPAARLAILRRAIATVRPAGLAVHSSRRATVWRGGQRPRWKGITSSPIWSRQESAGQEADALDGVGSTFLIDAVSH